MFKKATRIVSIFKAKHNKTRLASAGEPSQWQYETSTSKLKVRTFASLQKYCGRGRSKQVICKREFDLVDSYLASWLVRKLYESPTDVNGLLAANLPRPFRHFACLFTKICKCFLELRSSGH